ncbi:MAG: hypothetical protein IPK70_15085 [Flavobacteriales bacterium]|jgi:hypothetical protein|nr:hypothetical protein [Flavobacteriales bacterium]
MKRVYQEHKHKRFTRKRARRAARDRELWLLWKTDQNKRLNGLGRKERQEAVHSHKVEIVKAPDVFSFRDNTEPSIKFVNRLMALAKRGHGAHVNLQGVEQLSNDATAILCSVAHEFSKKRLRFEGNKPENEKVCDEFERSGFFKHVQGMVLERNQESKDEITTKGDKRVRSEKTAEIIGQAARTIWGEERRCPGVQKSLIECMGNTKEHSNPYGNMGERWWLSVHHDDATREVTFSFVDYGVGIFESLVKKKKKGLFGLFFDKFRDSPNPELLKQILNGELKSSTEGTRTELVNRGKGLPGIHDAMKRKQLCDLVIISNNVRAFVDNETYQELKETFNGTFLQWKVTANSDNLPGYGN